MNSKESDLKNESREIYLSRLIEKLNSKKNSLQQLSNRYSKIRLLIFVMEVILFFSLFFFDSNLSAFISFIFFLVVFSVAVHLHNKLDYDIKKVCTLDKIKINTSGQAKSRLAEYS